MKLKKLKKPLIVIFFIILVLSITIIAYFAFIQQSTLQLSQVNRTITTITSQDTTKYYFNHRWATITLGAGVALNPVIVDAQGNVIDNFGQNTTDPLSVVFNNGESVSITGTIPPFPKFESDLPSTPVSGGIVVKTNKYYPANGQAKMNLYKGVGTPYQTSTLITIQLVGQCAVIKTTQANNKYFYHISCAFAGQTPACDDTSQAGKCKITFLDSSGEMNVGILKSEIECFEGETKCLGEESFICQNYKFVSEGKIEGKCGYKFLCENNENQCTEDYHYMLCEINKWMDKGVIVGKCGVSYGSIIIKSCLEDMEACLSNNLLLCDNGLWIDKGLTMGKCGYTTNQTIPQEPEEPETPQETEKEDSYKLVIYILIIILIIVLFLVLILLSIFKKKRN